VLRVRDLGKTSVSESKTQETSGLLNFDNKKQIRYKNNVNINSKFRTGNLDNEFKIHRLRKESRKGREFLARRAEILGAAEKLFAKRGFHGTTMFELAKLAEFSVGTIYNFFKTKQEVYYTLLIEKLDLFFSKLDKEVNQKPPGLSQILALIKASVEFFEENQDFFRIFVQERSTVELSLGVAAAKEKRKRYLAYIDFVAKVMAKAIEKGDIEKFNPLEIAYSLVGMLDSFCTYWTMYPESNGLGSKVPFVYDLFIKGAGKKRK
jgi:AcrR family transcriptional regulator